jgi:hypothetical protein
LTSGLLKPTSVSMRSCDCFPLRVGCACLRDSIGIVSNWFQQKSFFLNRNVDNWITTEARWGAPTKFSRKLKKIWKKFQKYEKTAITK